MSALLYKMPGTLAAPKLGKYANGIPNFKNGDGSYSLFAAIFPGSQFHVNLPSAGAPLTDLSGNGRTPTITNTNTAGTLAATGIQTRGFFANNAAWINPAYNSRTLSLDGPDDEFTRIFVGLFPIVSGRLDYLIYNGSETLYVANNSDSVLQSNDGIATAQSVLLQDGSGSTWRNASLQMLAARVNKDYCRMSQYRSGAAVRHSTTTARTSTPAENRVIGNTGAAQRILQPNTAAVGSFLAAHLDYNRVLTDAELATVYSTLSAIFANFGETL